MPADRPVTVTAWCWTVPAGSVTARPLIETDPPVGMLVHHETTPACPVTFDRYGPLAILTVPVAVVVAVFAVVAREGFPAESTAVIV